MPNKAKSGKAMKSRILKPLRRPAKKVRRAVGKGT
jgi:hypothetical protein